MPTRSRAIILVVVGVLLTLLAWALGFERPWERLTFWDAIMNDIIPNRPYVIPIFFLGLASVVVGLVLLSKQEKAKL